MFRLITFIALFLFSSRIFAQNNTDAILGTWLTGDEKGHVQIYKQNGKYFGKIVWIKEPLKDGKPILDTKNPDPKKRSQPVMGLVFLRNFAYEGDDVWEGGKIYDPESGKDYSCKMTLRNENTLDVRGFIGFSLLGRTDTWKRVKN
ncbi:MAG: DUF2147 domain-containing protein [Cytophagales bacterium]|jgi:uncharacterized protein (DUF2147 family)|nr:DUF2147 domain-containing protein [Cytophagales bacterium]